MKYHSFHFFIVILKNSNESYLVGHKKMGQAAFFPPTVCRPWSRPLGFAALYFMLYAGFLRRPEVILRTKPIRSSMVREHSSNTIVRKDTMEVTLSYPSWVTAWSQFRTYKHLYLPLSFSFTLIYWTSIQVILKPGEVQGRTELPPLYNKAFCKCGSPGSYLKGLAEAL